jgi:hypothetical protein
MPPKRFSFDEVIRALETVGCSEWLRDATEDELRYQKQSSFGTPEHVERIRVLTSFRDGLERLHNGNG